MRTITYIPTSNTENGIQNDCLLSTKTETSTATFTVSENGRFHNIKELGSQIRAGEGSTMIVNLSENELIEINIECTVIKTAGIPIKRPGIYVTKGIGTTRTSVQSTESELKHIGMFDIKEYTLTFPLKSPKEKQAVIHFGDELNIIKKISVTTTT